MSPFHPDFNLPDLSDPSLTDSDRIQYLVTRLQAVEFELWSLKMQCPTHQEIDVAGEMLIDALQHRVQELLGPFVARLTQLERSTLTAALEQLERISPEDLN